MDISLLSKDVRSIEDSFIELLRFSRGSKEDKQEFFRRRTKTVVTKASYKDMWDRLCSKFNRSGAAELVFDYLLDNAHPKLEERLSAARRDSHYPRRAEDPKIVEILFWKKGTPRRITEHLLDYMDRRKTPMTGSDQTQSGRTNGAHPYDVALSFAGEQRAYVDEVYRHLEEKGVRVFYDDAHDVEMWGKDLNEYLERIFRDQARHCVLFLSADYVRKKWPRKEGRAALERQIDENREYVLPVRFDDTDLPGLPGTIKYVEAPEDPKVLAEKIAAKIAE